MVVVAETADIPGSRRNPFTEPDELWEVFIAYLHGAPHRTGASFPLPPWQRVIVGRGSGKFGHKLPGKKGRSRELEIETDTIAGRELALTAHDDYVELEALSPKHKVRANGKRVVEITRIEDNAVVAVEGEMVLLLVKRSADMPAFEHFDPALMGPFGQANRLDLVGQSEAFCRLMDALVVAVATKMPILITGQSGVGKQLIAAAAHKLSRYATGPFVVENVSKLIASVAASQLFGHRARWPQHNDPFDPGWFGRARGGALLLDEFGDMQEPMRSMLLTALQEMKYTGADGAEEWPLDSLVLAATNVPTKLIRPDLRRRFHILHVPPFADRREDIPLLAAHIISEARMAEDRRAKELRNLPWVLEHVLMHPLEGNMRDLKEILLNGLLDIGTLKRGDGVVVAPPPNDDEANDDAVEITVRGLLHKHRGNQSAVERELGWTRSTLRAFMKRRGIEAK